MRYLFIILILSLLTITCGEDAPYEPDTTPDRSVHISPPRALIDLSDSLDFNAFNVYGAALVVVWDMLDVPEGDPSYGILDSTGFYVAPTVVPDRDSISISATLVDDATIADTAWIILVDPEKIYVDTSGSDSTGSGSKYSPYRTITKAIFKANSTLLIYEEIIIGAGTYFEGEDFPIDVGTGINLKGAGEDSTIVIGPGNLTGEDNSVFLLDGVGIRIEDLGITTATSNGTGIWAKSGTKGNIINNKIISNYMGIYVTGISPATNPVFEDNVIMYDSIGISANGACRPVIYGNRIDSCGIYGVEINDASVPDLGQNDSTLAGNNTIINATAYLVYNLSPDTIRAIGNEWGFIDPDPFIYDDDENPSSGPVITIP